jgi:Retroviral aspartyl protease
LIDYLVWHGDLPEGELLCELELNGVQIPQNQYAGLQQNAAAVKDPSCKVPRPVIVEVTLNGQPAKALIDSGSLSDFISNTLVDQLKCRKRELKTPLTLQLAVQGSHSKVNWGVTIDFAYQNIKEKQYFDATNLSNYDLILGTPFLFQHQATIGFNPA